MDPPNFEQYRVLVEHTPTMVWRVGVDAKCDYVNARWLDFTGRPLPRELGDGWMESVHPDDLHHCVIHYRTHFERREAFEMEYRLRRHDRVYRSIRHRGVPYTDAAGAFAGFIGSGSEVDELRDHDAASPAADLFERSLDHLCVAGLDGYFKRVNASWTKTLGWSPGELMARPSLDFVHPADREATLASRTGLKAGVPLLRLVNRYQCKDGTYRWFEWKSVAHVEQGLVYAVARDVTDEKEAQRVLREMTENLTTTLNSIADGVIAIDADGAVTRLNPMAEKLTGWTHADARGRPIGLVFNIVDADTRAGAGLAVERTLREGVPAALTNQTLLIARSGNELPIASTCTPMTDADGRSSGAVLVFRDMSAEKAANEARKRLQAQLILADRMASVGTLAAGVAHEINNPLAYAVANLDLMIEEARTLGSGASGGEWVEMAVEARQGAEKIRKIVRGLDTFSRAGEERRALIEVNPALELAITMAFNEIRHRARLVRDFGDIPLVEGDDGRLGQVFINLLVNAAHALPEGDDETNEIRVVTSTDAVGRAVVEIRDTGCGIAASVVGRIFDPFFTTKAIGVGTGLGLFICHNIVASMGGEITASSQEGRGSTFRVVLPAAPSRPRPTPAVMTPGAPATGRRAAVLIVDDERAVAAALGRVLREHDVTIVNTAREALGLVFSSKHFDVVFSDLMMPEMSGMEFYDEVARHRPRAAERMVFISGGAFTPAARAFLDRVPNERIAKPFDAGTMRALVQSFVK